jgi:hypothetical protein
LKVLHHIQIQGIGHGHIENAVLEADGHAKKLARNLLRDAFNNLGGDFEVLEIDIGNLELVF